MHRKSPSKIWRKFNNRYSLGGVKSKATGKTYYPPVIFESENNNSEFEIHKYKKAGKLVTWSVVNAAPNGFETIKPYIIAVIELEDGQRLTSQIVDTKAENLKKNDVLVPTFRKIYEDGEDGIIHYGLKWTKVN
jgi:uncharacterized OB-fold protein